MARLILALDKHGWEITPDRLGELVSSGVDMIKLTAAGLFNELYSILNGRYIYSSDQYTKLFLDLKIADISFEHNKGTNYKIVESISRDYNCVDAISIHGFMGLDAIREAVSAASSAVSTIPPKILVLCAMTDPAFRQYFNEEDTYQFVSWTKDAGAYGTILPANDLHLVKQVLKRYNPCPVWSPGFGRQNLSHNNIYDQLKDWRSVVGEDPRHAAIVGSHLLDHFEIKKEVERIKDIIH